MLHPPCQADAVPLFPFWPEIVGSARGWLKTGRYCPGIGKGDLIQIDVARAEADEMRKAYPHMYPAK